MVSKDAQLVLFFMFGVYIHYVLDYFNIRNEHDGVDYYAEVHHSFQNKLCHTIGMPFTMFGAFLWIPALLFGEFPSYYHYKKYNYYILSEHFRNCILMIYIGMYAQIDILMTLFVIAFYYPSYYYSMVMYRKLSRLQNFTIGLTTMVVALYFQELVGHKWGGDPASRIAFYPIFNAVLYAPWFSVSHFIK